MYKCGASEVMAGWWLAVGLYNIMQPTEFTAAAGTAATWTGAAGTAACDVMDFNLCDVDSFAVKRKVSDDIFCNAATGNVDSWTAGQLDSWRR